MLPRHQREMALPPPPQQPPTAGTTAQGIAAFPDGTGRPSDHVVGPSDPEGFSSVQSGIDAAAEAASEVARSLPAAVAGSAQSPAQPNALVPFRPIVMNAADGKVRVAARLTTAEAEALAFIIQRSGEPAELWLQRTILQQVPPVLVNEVNTGAYTTASLEALMKEVEEKRVSPFAERVAPVAAKDPFDIEGQRANVQDRDRVRHQLSAQLDEQRRAQEAIPRAAGHSCTHCKVFPKGVPSAGYGKCSHPEMRGRSCNWPNATAYQCTGYAQGPINLGPMR